MRQSIDRVPATIGVGEFRERYYDPEIPVVVTGTPVPRDECLSSQHLKKVFGQARKVAAWHEVPLPEDDSDFPMPDLLKGLIRVVKPNLRGTPMRVWLHPGGHVSMYHYDGNSIHVFNQQARGRKRWTIISPDTPLPVVPFAFFSVALRSFEPDSAIHDFYEFETGPGDMLFLPRYWCHRVESLDSVNVNINWVWTPPTPNQTALGKRESEMLKARLLLKHLNRFTRAPVLLESYGGVGWELAREYARGVSVPGAVSRILKELSGYPRYLAKKKLMSREARDFTASRFAVPDEDADKDEARSDG